VRRFGKVNRFYQRTPRRIGFAQLPWLV
jgi:hypothetical protein